MYGEEALKDRQCRNWFDIFRSGGFSLKDEQRSGRQNEVDDDQIKAIIESDRHVTVLFFLNELSLVMKNGLFRITSFENDHGPSMMNHHEQGVVFF